MFRFIPHLLDNMATLGSSVNRPTNVKVRDENIETKLQLYAIYSAFKAGKVPSVS